MTSSIGNLPTIRIPVKQKAELSVTQERALPRLLATDSRTNFSATHLPVKQKAELSVTQERTFFSPLVTDSRMNFSATHLSGSHSKATRSLFVATTPQSALRLYDGKGRTNEESNLLVQSGNELFGQEELQKALANFTAAIADIETEKHRNKLKGANKELEKEKDLSLSQAYFGAAAIYDHQGQKKEALESFLKGSVLLNRVQPHSLRLAGSYFRIAMLHKENGPNFYHHAIDFLKKALKIYKLNKEHEEYVATIHKYLSELHSEREENNISAYHNKIYQEMKYAPQHTVKLQRQEGFLHEFFTREKGEISSRSSAATEPSPFRAKSLPPIFQDAANSPIRFEGVSKSIETVSVLLRDIECSPFRILHRQIGVQSSPKKVANQSIATVAVGLQDQECSPFRVFHRQIGVQSSPKEVANQSIATVAVGLQDQECSPFRVLHRQIGVQSSPKKVANQSIATMAVSLHDQQCSPFLALRCQVETQSSPQDTKNLVKAPNSLGMTLLLKKLSDYASDKPEKMKAIRDLKEKLQTQTKEKALEYINGQLEIPNNPIFAGVRTQRVKELFLEAKHRLEG